MIEAQALSMRYGSVHALRDASFTAREGEVLGLLGPNGAGKTTTMRILTTFQLPTGGRATVAGHDVAQDPLAVRRRIGYLPETLPLYLSMEVRECLQFVGRARGLSGAHLAERIRWVVDRCGLDRMFHTPCLELSKGFRQRTALAQALLHDPDVVILDEPTTGLDPHQILEIRGLVRELAQSKTVLLSTHILSEADALSDRLIVMSRGRIAGQGTVDELRAQAGVAPSVHVSVRAPADAARAAIDALPAAGEVTDLQLDADDTCSLTVAEAAPTLAADLGRLAADQGWAITELHRRPGTLEDVFLRLTRDDEAAA